MPVSSIPIRPRVPDPQPPLSAGALPPDANNSPFGSLAPFSGLTTDSRGLTPMLSTGPLKHTGPSAFNDQQSPTGALGRSKARLSDRGMPPPGKRPKHAREEGEADDAQRPARVSGSELIASFHALGASAVSARALASALATRQALQVTPIALHHLIIFSSSIFRICLIASCPPLSHRLLLSPPLDHTHVPG